MIGVEREGKQGWEETEGRRGKGRGIYRAQELRGGKKEVYLQRLCIQYIPRPTLHCMAFAWSSAQLKCMSF